MSKVFAAVSGIPGAGYGVFAREPISAGGIVERCVVFPLGANAPLDVLSDYRLAWTGDSDAMASGCACLYNHSDTPNVEFVLRIEDRTLDVIAKRPIACGEELFKQYACGAWWTT